jgi:hypothetical protein
MTDILKICGTNVGSLRKAFLIFPEHVSNLGGSVQIIPIVAVPQLINQSIEENARFYDVQIDTNTGSFSERRVIDGRHEDYYNATLYFQIKKMRVEVDYMIQLIANTAVHVLFEDSNGLVKLMAFARLSDEAFSGDRRIAKNGYAFTFTKRSTRKTPSITNYSLNNTAGNAIGLNIFSVTQAVFDGLLNAGTLQEGLYIITDSVPKEAWLSGGGNIAVNITFGPLRYVKLEVNSSIIPLLGITASTTEQRQRMRFYRGNVEIFLDGDITILADDFIQFALPFENETFRAFY